MNNNKKPYSAGRIILFTIALSMVISLLAHNYSTILADKFGFQPTLYGTVNSWMIYMLLLTALVLLYKILHSQLNVQREQISLSKLHAHHIRAQHHADFTYTSETTSPHDEVENFLNPSFKITKNSAWNVQVACDLNHSLSLPYFIKRISGGYQSDASTLADDDILTVSIVENIVESLANDGTAASEFSSQEADLPLIASYKIKFSYQDEFGLAYAKTFILSYSLPDQKTRCISSNVDYL